MKSRFDGLRFGDRLLIRVSSIRIVSVEDGKRGID